VSFAFSLAFSFRTSFLFFSHSDVMFSNFDFSFFLKKTTRFVPDGLFAGAISLSLLLPSCNGNTHFTMESTGQDEVVCRKAVKRPLKR
jgi:hypothetical protein